MKVALNQTSASPYFIGIIVSILTTYTLIAQPLNLALSYVGNPGNTPDSRTARGAVNYEYQIGTYDITVDQYTAFLNAVAKRDRYRLYSPHKMAQMGRSTLSTNVDEADEWNVGIARAGDEGSYSYSVLGTSGSMPAVWITWFDAARFCNWMHNGQPKDLGEVADSTETGAYTLNGDCIHGGESRNPGAKWWIPSADEWYKAAYYDPRLNGGRGGYWQYPTQSDTVPGNEIGSGSNEANAIANGSFSVKGNPDQEVCLLTPVGSFPNSHSYYGCYDMAGDAQQWTDTVIVERYTRAKDRGIVGGCFNIFTYELDSSNNRCDLGGPQERQDSGVFGFRVATLAQSTPAKH